MANVGTVALVISVYTGMGMHPALRWGLLGLLAGMGFVLLRQRKS